VVQREDKSTAADKPGVSDTTPLRIAGSWLQALTDGSREVVALLDQDGSVQYLSVSGAVQNMLGYEALEIMAMSPTELLHPLDTRRVLDGFRTVAAHPGGRITLEYRARHRTGHYVRLESTAVNRLRNDYVAAIVVHTREVHASELPPARPSAPPLPNIDDEADFLHGVAEAIERASGEAYKFSVLVLELDRGDTLVEAYGEAVAEGVMAEVGRRLAALLRPGDSLCRLPESRHAILLDGVGDRPLAERIAARVQKTVGNRFHVRGQDILSSAIIGMATSERRYERAEDVIRDASLAAAQARNAGPKQRRAVYRTQMHVEKTRHLSLLAELHNALQRGQFRVYYLPIIGLATRTVSGFEALVRWQHPDRGIISPDLFIPVAEDTGLIVPLGEWIMREACRQMADWHARYQMDPPLTLSVNVAAKQFAEYDLHELVQEIIKETGFDGHQLTLEVCERAVVECGDAVAESLRRLGKLGVSASLDNFGVGASSFAYLHQMPYSRLKIDRSLVQEMATGGRGRELVQAIVNLAHNLSMEVIAEGVETPGQAAQLSKMWCEYAQGYLFGKPMDSDEAGAFIASYPRWWE